MFSTFQLSDNLLGLYSYEAYATTPSHLMSQGVQTDLILALFFPMLTSALKHRARDQALAALDMKMMLRVNWKGRINSQLSSEEEMWEECSTS